MTQLYYDDLFLEHKITPGHPERPERLVECWKALNEAGLVARAKRGSAAAVNRVLLASVHSANQIDRAEKLSAAGSGFLEGDTPVSERSFDAALLAAGCGVAAIDAVLSDKANNAFCLVRPPGHHSTPNHSMGFCLFNSIALAARHALDAHHLSRVLIVDWDVHHGNGTQDIFYEEPRVMFFSAHRYPFYPGTGSREETGRGKGLGFTLNLPIAFGSTPQEYRDRFAADLETAAKKIKPELVLLSAGFDCHKRDPIGNLGLDVEDFVELGKMVIAVADEHCKGRLVSLLEGGYNLAALGQSVTAHFKQLLERDSKPAATGP